MGILEEVLAKVDALRRTAKRNWDDSTQQSSLYMEKVTDALRNTNRGVVPVASNGELTNRSLTPSERVEQTMGTLDFGGGLGVIKPKGGNWLSGQVEGALSGLKKRTEPYTHRNAEGWTVAPEYGQPMPEAEIAALRADPTWAQNQELNQWIDKKLTRYVKNEMATPEDPVRLMADKFPAEKAAKLAEAEAKVNALRQKQQAQAATRGVPEEYLTRTRQEVLAAEEARDLIAENQGLHIAGNVPEGHLNLVQGKRARFGQEPAGMAQTDLGKMWEARGDLTVFPREAGEFKLPTNLRTDPWLANQADNVPVYTTSGDLTDNMGFRHLTDELSNSLREGRISPEVLGKMNMEQAVRHVAEVNALRAVEANKARAMDMKDIPIHKDYPDQGYSWRQLKHEDEPTLQKWLTQEGDAMGHCVGGYCPDVKSGVSNIYSLRDAKGRPHVTIETAKPGPLDWYLRQEDVAHLPEEPELDDAGAHISWLQQLAQTPEYVAATQNPSVIQIKGKANAAPKAEYLPFIQDFVRSGKWSDIGDAAHTGLSSEEIDQILRGTK